MSAFAQDLLRWQDTNHQPVDGSPLTGKLGLGAVAGLLWRFPALWATAIFRAGNWTHRRRLPGLPFLFQRLNMLLFGFEIASHMAVGPGLYIPHPVGMVLMARSIGANATFVHAVTLGMRDSWDFPTLGDGVFVGAGARVLGGIRLGEGCRIGAGAVVLEDVPPGATAVGVPARILKVRNPPLGSC